MSFKSANIWQAIRKDAFNTVQGIDRKRIDLEFGLDNWKREGEIFSWNKISSNSWDVSVDQSKYSNALYVDFENLLNSAIEQEIEIKGAYVNDSVNSPAWTLVKIYYWAFFSALSIARLVGRTVSYCDSEGLPILTPYSGKNIGGGTYIFSFSTLLGGNKIGVVIKKSSDSHFHRSVWKQMRLYFGEKVRIFGNREASSSEYSLFEELSKDSHDSGAWMSEFRNWANYRPGAVYRKVLDGRYGNIRSKMNPIFEMDLNDLSESITQMREHTGGYDFDYKNCENYYKYLVSTAVVLDRILVGLYFELHSSGLIDKRWLDKRDRQKSRLSNGLISKKVGDLTHRIFGS